MMQDSLPILGVEIKNGNYLDLGNKLEYMKANIDFALRDPDIGDELKAWLVQKY
jgi:UTP--glucose-1-phosphate uridylyltransferase